MTGHVVEVVVVPAAGHAHTAVKTLVVVHARDVEDAVAPAHTAVQPPAAVDVVVEMFTNSK